MKIKKATYILLIIAVFAMMLAGCGDKQKQAEAVPDDATVSDTAVKDITANDADISPDAQKTPVEDLQWDSDTLKNETGKTLIKCIGNQRGKDAHVSFGIVSSSGTTILADPIYSTKEKGYIRTDIITVSHGHADHYNQKLQTKMKDHARLSYFTPESFAVKDVNVIGVAASHSSEPINEQRPGNTIYVFELDGLRIAHMGDMGQDELTTEQIERLGQLDIIFTVLTDAPDFGSSTEKNIKIIQQLDPKIVIPTHYNEDVIKETMDSFGILEYEKAAELAVSKDELNESPMRFILLE